MAELRARRDTATRADLVELRLDGVADVDVAGALAGRRAPVVVTCRPTWEGGRFDGDETTRLSLLSSAARLGAEYVDVEARAEWTRVDVPAPTARILSFHDWQGPPADLAARIADMRRSGSILKIAVTAHRLTDCVRLRDAAGSGASGPGQILIAMGPRGQLTRLCPWLFDSSWTYSGHAAPGQMTTDTLVDRYRLRRTGRATAIYGVAGRPVDHSASPAMHNAAFEEMELDAVYVPLDGESADDVLAVAESFGIRGLSVTAPFKRELAARARADAHTARLGAVNTLRRDRDGWEARNFDPDGFLAPIDAAGIRIRGRRALVIGAGGAARAVAAALAGRDAVVTVTARHRERAEVLARECGVAVAPDVAGEWEVVVNATPVGTWPAVDARPPLPRLAPGALAYDLVYNPPETAWLRDAKRAGATAIGGLPMLVEQACQQFTWWTGCPAPRAAMARAAETFVTEELRISA